MSALHSTMHAWLLQIIPDGQSELYTQVSVVGGDASPPSSAAATGSFPASLSMALSAHVPWVHACPARQSLAVLHWSRQMSSTPHTWPAGQSLLYVQSFSTGSWHTSNGRSLWMHCEPPGQSRDVEHWVWHRWNAHTSGESQSLLTRHPPAIAFWSTEELLEQASGVAMAAKAQAATTRCKDEERRVSTVSSLGP
jgi:hypothetical protein